MRLILLFFTCACLYAKSDRAYTYEKTKDGYDHYLRGLVTWGDKIGVIENNTSCKLNYYITKHSISKNKLNNKEIIEMEMEYGNEKVTINFEILTSHKAHENFYLYFLVPENGKAIKKALNSGLDLKIYPKSENAKKVFDLPELFATKSFKEGFTRRCGKYQVKQDSSMLKVNVEFLTIHDPDIVKVELKGVQYKLTRAENSYESFDKINKGEKIDLIWSTTEGLYLKKEEPLKIFISDLSKDIHPIEIDYKVCRSKNNSTMDHAKCIGEYEKRWDIELNRVYKEIPELFKKEVREMQREWLKYRDARKKTISKVYTNRQGTIWSVIAAGEVARIVRDQAILLNELLSEMIFTDEELKEKEKINNLAKENDNLIKLLDAYSSLAKKDAQTLKKFNNLYDVYEKIRKSDSGDGKITYGLGFLFKKLLIANSVDIPLNGVYVQNKKINGEWQNINCTKYKKLTGDQNKCGSWLPKKSQIIKLVDYSMNNKGFKGEKLYILKNEESKWLKKYFNYDCSLQKANNDDEKSFISSLCN